jgi:hypothetical protein
MLILEWNYLLKRYSIFYRAFSELTYYTIHYLAIIPIRSDYVY